MAWKIEVTDTFGGEANYCWVKRGETKSKTRRGKIEAVKRVAGWNGWCRVKVTGIFHDMMEIRPVDTAGICQIAFLIWEED